ncbi:hypothetical protein C8R47DRAFT_157244 [Mycena vitilis]|nr:hypothetical protein C8R47DRAFT_157244 [Mycena vitilis]
MDANSIVNAVDMLDEKPDPHHNGLVHGNDTVYFFEDGDCIFEVVGVCFKLHKLFLSRDPESVFRNMFNIPQGSATEGLALDPIPLSGDSLKDFRALCWALYALPTELQSQNDREANIERLVAVARISHKYCLSSFEAWALSVVWIHSQSDRDYLDGCAQYMLDETYEAAANGGRHDLCSLVEQKWVSRLRRRDLPLRHALDFGEAHGMQTFLVEAYYQQARNMKVLAPKLVTGSEVADFCQLDLTPGQMHHLLAGYCSLTLFWESVTNTTLKTCSTNSRYHKNTMHDVAVRDPKDPLGIIEALHRARAKAGEDNYCSCRSHHIDTLISGFSPANHFSGQFSGC